MAVKVKICGITNWEDAKFAIETGADAIGLLVDIPPCEEKIDKKTAKEIILKTPSHIETFLITTSYDTDSIIKLGKEINGTTIQIVQDLELGKLEKIKTALPNRKIAKVIAVIDERAMDKARKYSKISDIMILDSKNVRQIGGTGDVHDWNISAKIVKECELPIFLAGGLAPDNVAKAIKEVRPYGVDADTRLNIVLGKKDPDRVKKFIEIVKKSK